MNTELINASFAVEKYVSRAIPFRRRLRAILLRLAELLSLCPALKLEDIALLLTLLAIMVFAYFVDFAMLSPIAEYAGRTSRIGAAMLMRVIPIVLPALVLLIESWIAHLRHEAKESQKTAMFADSSSVTKYTIIGIIFSIFIPLMNIALTRTMIAHLRAAGANDAKLSGLQFSLWLLAVLSFAAHLVIVFAGDGPKKLKTLLLCGIAATWLTIIKKIREWRYEPRRRIARLKVVQYLFIRQQVMKETGEFIPIGPFANDVQEWIREEFTNLDTLDPSTDNPKE
jgi:hypothetical protein